MRVLSLQSPSKEELIPKFRLLGRSLVETMRTIVKIYLLLLLQSIAPTRTTVSRGGAQLVNYETLV